MKQRKLAGWLKILTAIIGIIGIIFFGGVTALAFYLKSEPTDWHTDLLWTFIFFTWITAIICYCILYQFWNICVEIGNDNSFSLENTASFHKMCILSIIMGVCYLIRGIWLLIIGDMRLGTGIYIVFFILLSCIFAGLCEALSRLVQNAYEVKRENELTI